jgi:regulator of cell morphogenesis and NO signaling
MKNTAITETFESKTVGEIVADDWRTAAVFERFGVDYCCGGRRTVGDACRSAGIDVGAVEDAVATLPPQAAGEDASRWDVDRLVDHIVLTHHAYIRSALPRIATYLTKLVHVHGARHPELAVVAGHFETLGRELMQHMMKEERVLFPYVRELANQTPVAPSPFGTVENPIRMMEREHEEAGSLMEEIRRLTNAYTPPADGCATYRVCLEELAQFERDLHRHVHLENNVLFPKAVELESAGRRIGNA